MKKYLILTLSAIAMSVHLRAQETSLELPKGGSLLIGEAPTEPITAGTKPEKPKKELSENDSIYREAQRYLNGINTPVNYQKAGSRFAYLAELGDPRAMNALAGMYRQGMGTKQDRSRARKLYKKASDLGYGKASYNLAVMYKTAQGGKQDFQKAYEYMQLALKQGYKPAIYMLGYLNYKGLGAKQDYERAVKYFTRGTELKQGSSAYFLGLCYLGGFGVAKDTEKGKQLIEQAAKLGSDHAVEFIVQSRNAKYEKPGNIDPQGNPYPSCRKIENDSTLNLTGTWTGRILQYDWSRKHVLEERSLKLQLTDENGTLTGSWLQSDTVSMNVQATRTTKSWKAESMQYLQFWDRTWELRILRFSQEIAPSGDTILYANLLQFSPQTVEPSSPLMLELRRARFDFAQRPDNDSLSRWAEPVEAGVENRSLSGVEGLTVYPNPFKDELNVQITTAKAQNTTLFLYDLSGRIIKTETWQLAAGEQTKTLQTEHLPIGTYAVSVKGNGLNLNTIVIKK